MKNESALLHSHMDRKTFNIKFNINYYKLFKNLNIAD